MKEHLRPREKNFCEVDERENIFFHTQEKRVFNFSWQKCCFCELLLWTNGWSQAIFLCSGQARQL